MSENQTNQFYTELEAMNRPASDMFGPEANFSPVPDDWHVIVTDVKGSTALVAAGHHQTINLVATGSIIAALNIAHAHGIEIPFFFGGDGATLLVPHGLLTDTIAALQLHRRNAQIQFDLDLRVGTVPVATIYQRGSKIAMCKMYRTDAFAIPIVTGDGLHVAEKIVKSHDTGPSQEESGILDLTGMECRWNRVPPPPKTDEVVCLLVNINAEQDDLRPTREVLLAIERIYGSRQRRNPISSERLQLTRSTMRIARESRARLGRFDWRYVLEHWIRTALIGPAFLRLSQTGKHYVEQTPALSDTLVLDGRINTVISGTVEQREQLTRDLTALEQSGKITFGIHCSPASIMSCYVRNRDDAHVHFVDGADGGYTNAAIMLKQKLATE